MTTTNAQQPAFIITIDVEGDNIWRCKGDVRTRNALYLPRFQSLCEKYDLKPTYLVNYEMALCDDFVRFGRDAIESGNAEIGMHLHAWNSPPVSTLTSDDWKFKPYLIEYPVEQISDKVGYLTKMLEDTFGKKMTSHRAGRFALNSQYAHVLLDHGYEVDCSVTPGISWRGSKGDPIQSGGTDFSNYPNFAYFLDRDDLALPASYGLLEVPVTIMPRQSKFWWLPKEVPIVSRVARRLSPTHVWLRPNGRNRDTLVQIAKERLQSGADYAEFMLHSSEFMPGGSPYFPTQRSIEILFRDIEYLFQTISASYVGETLTEFSNRYRRPAG